MIERFELMAKLRRDLLHQTLLQKRKQILFDLIYQKMTPGDWAYNCCRLRFDNEK